MIDIEIDDEAWNKALPDAQALAQRAAEAAEPSANLVVLLTSDETVRDLNARFRHKDAATNVLSFPMQSLNWPVGVPRAVKLRATSITSSLSARPFRAVKSAELAVS